MSTVTVAERVDSILERIQRAATSAGRDSGEITLVAVSKKQPVALMNEVGQLILKSGRTVVFGENYLQEFLTKREQLTVPYESHLIGPMQSNKVAKAVASFSLIESIQSERILHLVEKECLKQQKSLSVFLQINISADPAKAGISVAEGERILNDVIPSLKAVSIKGLMTITEFFEEPEMARADFAKLREFSGKMEREIGGNTLALSMGMSADFDIAIQEGATHVRVGSALFGERV